MFLLQMAGPYSSDGRDCKNGEYQKSDSITTVGTWRVSKSSWRKKGWCGCFFFFQYSFFCSKIASQNMDSRAAIQINVTKRMRSFFPPCREDREEEEQQKLKEQHDIPASSLQSPGKTAVQANDISRFATWSANVPSHIPWGLGIFW